MVSLINPIAGKDQATGAQTAVLVVKKMACSPSSLSTYPLRRARGRRYCAYFKKGSFPPTRSSLLSLPTPPWQALEYPKILTISILLQQTKGGVHFASEKVCTSP